MVAVSRQPSKFHAGGFWCPAPTWSYRGKEIVGAVPVLLNCHLPNHTLRIVRPYSCRESASIVSLTIKKLQRQREKQKNPMPRECPLFSICFMLCFRKKRIISSC
jgi:hypothetical protein